MSKDLLFSVTLHVAIVAATFISAPFTFISQQDYGEVIRVTAVTMAEITPPEPEPEPIIADIPQVVEPEPEPEEVPIDEPEPELEPEPEPEPEKPVEKPPEKPKPKPTPKNDEPATQTSDNAQSGVEEGSSNVDTPAGSMLSGAVVDNSAFQYPFWFSLTWGKISQNFRVPVAIDGKVYCDIYFQVIKSGRVIESRIANPSGIAQFDKACLEAVERSAPFPPLPRDFLDEIIGITITFTN